jgi:hypothetical protein
MAKCASVFPAGRRRGADFADASSDPVTISRFRLASRQISMDKRDRFRGTRGDRQIGLKSTAVRSMISEDRRARFKGRPLP